MTESSSSQSIFEPTEWLDYRVFHAEQNNLPRVFLLGDSISGGYFPGVTQALEGNAYVSRLGSSKPVCHPFYLSEVGLALSQHSYAVIHFNNGLHGWDYTEGEYEHGLAMLVDYLKTHAPKARLIWASSTQCRTGAPDFAGFEPNNDRVKARNQIAADLMAKEDIPVNDLYLLTEPNHSLLCDGIHYKPEGYQLITAQVLTYVKKALASLD